MEEADRLNINLVINRMVVHGKIFMNLGSATHKHVLLALKLTEDWANGESGQNVVLLEIKSDLDHVIILLLPMAVNPARGAPEKKSDHAKKMMTECSVNGEHGPNVVLGEIRPESEDAPMALLEAARCVAEWKLKNAKKRRRNLNTTN